MYAGIEEKLKICIKRTAESDLLVALGGNFI